MFIAGTKKPKVKKIEIIGGRYTDRNGNTYHKSAVYVNDKKIAISPRTYGYGNQYEYSGMQEVVNRGYFPRILKKAGDIYYLPRELRQRGIKVKTKAIDFKRKKDFDAFEGA